MNFVAQVEESLRDLGSQAKKKHPGVKEASERAILQLRLLQTKYVSAVRQSASVSAKHPTTAIFQSQDILRPFLLCANYPDVNYYLLSLVLKTLQLLSANNAICKEDSVHIVRVLCIQANICCSSLGGCNYLDVGDSNNNSSTIRSSGESVSHTNQSAMGQIGSSLITGILGGVGRAGAIITGSGGGYDGMTNDANVFMSGGGYSSSSGGMSTRSVKEDEALAIKILQTLTMIVDSRELNLSQEVLSQCIAVCLVFIHNGAAICGNGGNNVGSSNYGSGDSGSAKSKGNFIDGTIGSARKVRRASIATLRQIIAILFDRATNIVVNSEDECIFNDGTSTLLPLAYRTFLDLCTFAERSSTFHDVAAKDETSISEPIGPFSQALQSGGMGSYQLRVQPPPRGACFDLIEMILRQHVKLFTTFSTTRRDEDAIDKDTAVTNNMEFPFLLKNHVCPLLSNTLTSEFVFDLNRASRYENENANKNSDVQNKAIDTNNPASFSLLLILIKLASTVITSYGPRVLNDKAMNNSCEKSATFMLGECHVLLVSLVKFIKAVTEVYKDSYDFEDGSMYSNEEEVRQEKDMTTHMQSSRQRKRLRLGFAASLLMWRAAISIEFFFNLVSEHFNTLMAITFTSFKEHNANDCLLAIMAEAVSDFAIVASSNNVGISQVVYAVRQKHENINIDPGLLIKDIKPTICARARAATNSFDEWNSVEYFWRGSLDNHDERRGDRLSSEQTLLPVCDVGEAVWISFHFILSLWSHLHPLKAFNDSKDQERMKSLIDKSFASSMAIFQHFLKRFPGSKMVMNQALRGYTFLANSTFSLETSSSGRNLQRRTILTSLCNLSLPPFADSEIVLNIDAGHLRTLSTLLGIIHSNYDEVGKDWDIILCAFEHLSLVSTLPKGSSKEERSIFDSIAACFCRIATFTTCFRLESIIFFIDALVSMSNSPFRIKQSKEATATRDETKDQSGSPYDKDVSDKDFFGGKMLLSFAGRSLNGLGAREDTREGDGEGLSQVLPSKLFIDDYCDALYCKLVSTKPSTPKDNFRSIPLPLLLLADLSIENSFRFMIIGEKVMSHLCDLAIGSQPLNARLFSMDILSNLITKQLHFQSEAGEASRSQNYIYEGATDIEDYFKVNLTSRSKEIQNVDESDTTEGKISQGILLSPLCRSFTMSKDQNICEAGINILLSIIDGSGHSLTSEAWVIIIQAISTISGCDNGATLIDRSTPDWSTSCTLAFRCLKLIIDDFLNVLPDSIDFDVNASRSALLDCCAAFGRSRHDLNISLTATGMLWTIADQDSTLASLNSVLSKLAILCSDSRPEVRNCSVNTFFSCVVGLGQTFNSEQWQLCLKMMFSVLDDITSHNFINDNKDTLQQISDVSNNLERYKVSVHHSRDSSSKQWATTMILALTGVERVLRQYFDQLIRSNFSHDAQSGISERDENCDTKTTFWFTSAWSYILNLALRCSMQIGDRDILDLRITGIDLIILCCQVSSVLGIVSSNDTGRVGTNMKVINGALRTVRAANDTKTITAEIKVDENQSLLMNNFQKELFKTAFNMLKKLHDIIDEANLVQEDGSGVSLYSEATHLQVLTKLCQGMVKLYDSCKDHELKASDNLLGSSGSEAEKEFVNLVRSIMIVTEVSESKYLSQAQRSCLHLLQTMVSSSSSVAFDMLAQISRPALLSDNSHLIDGVYESGSVLGLEAAKVVAERCSDEDAAKASIVQYAFMFIDSCLIRDDRALRIGIIDHVHLVSIVCGCMKALGGIEMTFESNGRVYNIFDNISIDDVWSKILVFLNLLLLESANEDSQIQTSKNGNEDILTILSECLNSLPLRLYTRLGDILAVIVKKALELLKEKSPQVLEKKICVDEDQNQELMKRNMLKLFNDGFRGLCKLIPENELPRKIAKEVFEVATTRQEMTPTIVSLSTSICEAVKDIPNSYSIAAELHRYLCLFISCNDESLRQQAADVIAIIDLPDMIERISIAEERSIKARHELETIACDLELERKRTNEAEDKIVELNSKERKLLDEIEVLKEKNDFLEQQLINTSENFTYT